ncbi:MAG: LysR family transcriptional regulator [Xanthomonadales bacterium]|nr:LysR family transcriptional regulator [Xanthomonadales bacterium]
MQDLNDLYYFVQVVDHGGFAPAGRALGIPKSKLSRRVALLESRLGVRLIQRSSRKFAVTEPGQTYYGHARAALVEARAAEEAIQRDQAEPRGVVRMSCPTTLLDAQVGAMVSDFLRLYPQVELHLDATNRRVDVIGEGVDIAIRVRPPPLEDSDLVLRVLATRTQCLVASPVLLARLGQPASPGELMNYPSMDLGLPQNLHVWDLHGPDGEHVAIHHQPRFVTRGMLALRDAAIAGVGIVQLPKMVTQELVAQGRLQHVLEGWAPRAEIVHAVFPSRRGLLPSVRALIDFLAERFAAIDND